jgi:G-patch domain
VVQISRHDCSPPERRLINSAVNDLLATSVEIVPMTMSQEEEEEYFLPLQDQQVFGAGIRRKRVPFVYAQSESATTSQAYPNPGLGEKYLSIVLPQSPEKAENTQECLKESRKDKVAATSSEVICAICSLPIASATPTSSSPSKPHDSSIAHQVCLSHSHPPSHLDRENVGVRYLSSYGWDPDARLGLGTTGTGIRTPIKSKIKNDTVGLGVKDGDRVRVQKESKGTVRLNAKQLRILEIAEKKREAKLRQDFYGKDLDAYLGTDG